MTTEKVADFFCNLRASVAGLDFLSLKLNQKEKLLLKAPGLSLDFSRQRINEHYFRSLFSLLDIAHFSDWREQLFSGGTVNLSEGKPAGHTWLRQKNPPDDIKVALNRMADAVRRISDSSHSSEKITDVVHIGIGGSSLGPRFLYESLKPFATGPKCHFVSNLDEWEIRNTLDTLNPQKTLVIVISKSFTTFETMENAIYAKHWLQQHGVDCSQHMWAVTESKNSAKCFGILDDYIFPLWSWVGGRYSITSCVSISSVMALGMEIFNRFLSGARAMDEHFFSELPERNVPIVMALLSIWENNVLNCAAKALIPYASRLKTFPLYAQQLYMESLGKSVDQQGRKVSYDTCPFIWGGCGTDSQHSFHQVFMQGTRFSSIDFILPRENLFSSKENHRQLIANGIAQADAIYGKHRSVEGNISAHEKTTARSSVNLLWLNHLDAYSLGALVALYEHVVFTQAVIWGINPFDQWGVQYGKILAKQLLSEENQGVYAPTVSKI